MSKTLPVSALSTVSIDDICPPYPGRFTTREGVRLQRTELLPLVDSWIDATTSSQRVIIQGGNRYISAYLSTRGINHTNMKVMSIEKAPLKVHLMTLLSDEELEEKIVIKEATEPPHTRRYLLQKYAQQTVESPFSPSVKDDSLSANIAEAIQRIDAMDFAIEHLSILREIMVHTRVGTVLASGQTIECIDDLFYRGRTLYTMAILAYICGGNPQNIHTTTIGCDMNSVAIATHYHSVLRPGILYPFENSIRSEKGYWQYEDDRYVFVDLCRYWQILGKSVTSPSDSMRLYDEWSTRGREWLEQHNISTATTGLTPAMLLSLLGLSVFCSASDVRVSIDTLVDQKADNLGPSAFFANYIDNYISQEETVESRASFKQKVRDTFTRIFQANSNSLTYTKLVDHYKQHNIAIEFSALQFLVEEPISEQGKNLRHAS